MKLIVCLDERRGMAFAGRRQSKDRCVTEDILRETAGGTLYVTSYTAKLFEGSGARLEIAADPLAAAEGDRTATVFLETVAPPRQCEEIDAVTVYLWGRTYPRDLSFDTDLSRFTRRASVTFKGNSHEMITKEIYTR